MAAKGRAVLVVAVGLAGCALVSGPSERKRAEVVGNRLVAAGFHAVPADTPEKKAHLATMPKLLFSTVVRDGKRRHLLADPYRCLCVYVGDDAAYRRYTQLEIAGEDAASLRAQKHEDMDAGANDQEMDDSGPYDADVVWPTGAAP